MVAAGRDRVPAGPSDPEAKVPSARYESPFKGYRAGAEEKSASWKETNDLVRKLGGWSAFARDQGAGIPAAAAPAPNAPAGAAPSKDGHAGHGKH